MAPSYSDAIDRINTFTFSSSLHIQHTATLKEPFINDEKDCRQHSGEQGLDDLFTKSPFLEHDESPLILRTTTKTFTTTLIATTTNDSTGGQHRDLFGSELFKPAGLMKPSSLWKDDISDVWLKSMEDAEIAMAMKVSKTQHAPRSTAHEHEDRDRARAILAAREEAEKSSSFIEAHSRGLSGAQAASMEEVETQRSIKASISVGKNPRVEKIKAEEDTLLPTSKEPMDVFVGSAVP